MTKVEKEVRITVQSGALSGYRGDVLAVGLFKGAKRLGEAYSGLEAGVKAAVGEALAIGDFAGKANETAVLYPAGKGRVRRVLLVGLGEEKKFSLNGLRQAAGTAVRRSDKLGAERVGLALHQGLGEKWDLTDAGQMIAEGAVIGRYEYRDYMAAEKDAKVAGAMRAEVLEAGAGKAAKLNRGLAVGRAIGEGQNQARRVANTPGNEVNPPVLAKLAQGVAKAAGLRCRVFDDRQLAGLKMNTILAVGSGSVHKPRLIMLEHRGRKGRGASGEPDVVVVGKAITFDTGGICLKPAEKMERMKYDKSGGCAVLGVMRAVAALKLPLHVVGLIPSAENMPSATSYRPGDIIRTYSGKTVEIQNTDAEGRLILCDALAYAAKMKPGAIIDVATLTGACVIALGEHYAGLFSNDEKLRRQIEAASERSGESVWALPSGGEYLDQLRSKMADLRNIGGREGGSCTAATFLREFVGEIPWAHIDIAGTADTDKERSWRAVGATGFTVRLIVEYLLGRKGTK